MDSLLKIFSRIGVDETMFVQLAVFCLLYFLLREILFKKLLWVLEYREEKTKKLEKLADDKMLKVKKMKEEYEQSVEKVYAEAEVELKKRELKSIEKEKKILEDEEKSLSKKLDDWQQKMSLEKEEARKILKKDIAPLANMLLHKISEEKK